MIRIPSNCTGCSACIEICPKNCIISEPDTYGFTIPKVDPASCINCGLCEKVCPAYNPGHPSHPEIYVGQNPDKIVVKESSSGGIFSLLANGILQKDGIIYGVEIDYSDNYKIKHVRITDASELYRLRGSKYVQSEILGIFPKVYEDLKDGKLVLFSGTPCQISGLKRFLRKDYDNLYTVDVICHGVPSPGVWGQYIREQIDDINHHRKNDSSSTILNKSGKETLSEFHISFRDKHYGWENFGFSISAKSNDEVSPNSYYIFFDRYKNPFMKGFLTDLYLRNSCYNCPVKGFSSGSDITLGDAWKVENYISLTDTDKGYSLICQNTDKGKRFIQAIGINLSKVPDDILRTHNPAAFVSPKSNKKRDKFFKLIAKGFSIKAAVDKCLPTPTIVDKILWSIKRRFNK